MRSLDSQSLLAALQRRSRALIIGFTATVLIAVVLLEGADLWWGYDPAIASAEEEATTLASLTGWPIGRCIWCAASGRRSARR